MKAVRLGAVLAAAGALRLCGSDPLPSQPDNAVNPPYSGGALNHPFPDNVYGADHGTSTLTLTNPFLSPFGRTDHSRGVVVYDCAPFTPRNSEGVYGMDVWLEQLGNGGSWSPVALNGGLADGASSPYVPVNTPNPGPSPAYRFQWTFDATPLPKFTYLRVFIYVYLYNQGGGSQGNFYVASTVGPIYTGAADDAPVIAWAPSAGAVNPAQVAAGTTYSISATGESDNGDLTSVTIWQNAGAFAAAGAGDGWSSNAAGTAQGVAGAVVNYSAEAIDAQGLPSPIISLTVNVAGKLPQAPISAADATVTLGEPFTPGYTGGSGTGVWQFCVGGQTNFDGGASGNSGTELGGGSWSPSWTATSLGSYDFWIARGGDAAYLPAPPAGPYVLTVVAPPGSTPSTTPPPNGGPTLLGGSPLPAGTPAATPAAPADANPAPANSSGQTQPTAPAPQTPATPDIPVSPTAPDSNGSSPGSPATATSGSGASPAATSNTGTPAPGGPAGSPAGAAAGSAGSSTSSSAPASGASPGATAGSAPAASSGEIVRIRFNALGEETSVHDPTTHSDTPIWTDPASLTLSPWPVFASPTPVAPLPADIVLPAIPTLP